MTESQFVTWIKFLEKSCPYRVHNFCDGTPNKSVSRYIRTKQTCQYFKDGRCKLQNKGVLINYDR